MNRTDAHQITRKRLNEFGLKDWGIRVIPDLNRFTWVGKCDPNEKIIYLNSHHLDTHPDSEVLDTINHEIAHALTTGHGHDDVWKAKAKELGASPVATCGMALSPIAIDAIRSGHILEMEIEEETIVTRTPKYRIKRLQDTCPVCGKEPVKVLKEWEALGIKFKLMSCGDLVKIQIGKPAPFETLVSNWWKPEVAACKHKFNTNGAITSLQKNQCLWCKEFQPFPFQVTGMVAAERALTMQRGFGIFDEQGLGKTIQTLGLFHFLEHLSPFVFLCKSGTKYQVYNEIIRWLGPRFLPQVITSGKEGVLKGPRAYIISYDMLRRFDLSKFEGVVKTVVPDEAQHIKNPDSTRTSEVRNLVRLAEHVLPLSGTPWKNRGSELFVALNLIDPGKFDSYTSFVNNWVNYYESGGKFKEGGIRRIEEFKTYTKDCFIRRERIDVMPDLPVMTRNKFYTELDAKSKETYDDSMSNFVKLYNEAVINGEEDNFASSPKAIAEMQRMRHIVALAKIPATIEFAEQFMNETERKLTIFVHHKDVGKILVNQLTSLKLAPVIAMTAELSPEERFAVQNRFNETARIVMIASTLASGEGLNLQTCSDCIMHERQWNPANEEQAEGRFIRIGQLANAVTATYMVAQNAPIDSQLDTIVEVKRAQFNAVMNKNAAPVWNHVDVMGDLIQAMIKDYNSGRKKK